MLRWIVDRYLERYPDEKKKLKVLLSQLKSKENLDDRENYKGHVTASSLIYSPDLKEILLIYHPSFECWMQPGGHVDPEEGPWVTAHREAVEETGVKIARRLALNDQRLPILIESHLVPSKLPKNEPGHYHHAFWYCFVAKSKGLKLEDEVIKKARWAAESEISRPVFVRAIEKSKKLPELKALA